MSECKHVWRFNPALQSIDCLNCGLITIDVTCTATGTVDSNIQATVDPDCEITVGVAANDATLAAARKTNTN